MSNKSHNEGGGPNFEADNATLYSEITYQNDTKSYANSQSTKISNLNDTKSMQNMNMMKHREYRNGNNHQENNFIQGGKQDWNNGNGYNSA